MFQYSVADRTRLGGSAVEAETAPGLAQVHRRNSDWRGSRPGRRQPAAIIKDDTHERSEANRRARCDRDQTILRGIGAVWQHDGTAGRGPALSSREDSVEI